MKENQDQPADAAPSTGSGQALRRRAEERLKARGSIPQSAIRNPHSEARLVHELQVHQIELEMQNEELQQARAQADALLAQYTDLYDFAPAGYLTLDREGAIRQVNLTGARLLGTERSRLVNRRFGLFVAEGDRRAFSDFLEKVFASEAKENCEVTLPQEGSQPLVVRIEGTRSADEQECRALVVDITAQKQSQRSLQNMLEDMRVENEARKQAEAALQAERNRLHNVLEVMPMMVCLLTPDYHVAFANRAFREKFGEAHGRRCYEYC
ncbi:MAG: PAS domain-containing protein, partial [candidate division NC10 bacterium]